MVVAVKEKTFCALVSASNSFLTLLFLGLNLPRDSQISKPDIQVIINLAVNIGDLVYDIECVSAITFHSISSQPWPSYSRRAGA